MIWERGIYEWECTTDVYPIRYPSDIPDECGTKGLIDFDPEEGFDIPHAVCTRCGSELSGTYDSFTKVEAAQDENK